MRRRLDVCLRWSHPVRIKRSPNACISANSHLRLCPAWNQVIFGTVNGAIGVMAVLQKDDFALLLKVQHALAQVIKGVGGFRHEVCVHVFVLSGLEGCICVLSSAI